MTAVSEVNEKRERLKERSGVEINRGRLVNPRGNPFTTP